jgi:hypothetical protein
MGPENSVILGPKVAEEYELELNENYLYLR